MYVPNKNNMNKCLEILASQYKYIVDIQKQCIHKTLIRLLKYE